MLASLTAFRQRTRKRPARGRNLERGVDIVDGSWYWLADLCATDGVEFHLAHAHRLQAIAQAKVKTDAVDALTLAPLLRADLRPEANVVTGARREQRDLLRTRLRLVQRRTGVKNSVARIFEKYNVSSLDRLAALS